MSYLCEWKEEALRSDMINCKTPMCAFLTSGSTGKAKTIVHTNQNIFIDTMRQIETNGITSSDKLDLVFSLSFSASLACIFPALLTGAELAIFNLKEKGLHNLTRFWHQKGITFSTLSVSTFQSVCKIHSSLKHLKSLRFISISAEPVKDTTISLFKSTFPHSSILQIAYATTETRTISDLKIYNDGRQNEFVESIGKPVKDKLVHITDAYGNSLPINTVGEITVVSSHIADRYWGQAEDSKLSFSKQGDLIHYRTGDLGYVNEEGYLFYKGRNAHEFKLNGVKINIPAIEEAVEKAEGILTAAVVISQSDSGMQKLTCFFNAKSNFELDKIKQKDEIRSFILNTMPLSHQPQYYIHLQEMPITHSGKIDRKALEKIDPVTYKNKIGNTSHVCSIEKDSTEAISKIIAIFKNILETEEIDENSDFFDCGGDSLSCLVCITEIETALNVELKTFALVSNPTPKKLIEFITIHRGRLINLIEVKELNVYSETKKNLYFLHHHHDSTYDSLIKGPLSAHFNLMMCYYDLRHIYTIDNASNRILQELESLIGKQENPIVVGYSISGYLAHQLACILPNITCTMIDTYNYFEIEKYNKKMDLKSKLQNLFWQIVQNKDFIYPWFLLQSKYKRLFIKKRKVWDSWTFLDSVNFLIKTLTNKRALNNCIYFQASRYYQDYGMSWKAYIKGNFHYFSFKATHKTIIKDHAIDISNCIIKTTISESIDKC